MLQAAECAWHCAQAAGTKARATLPVLPSAPLAHPHRTLMYSSFRYSFMPPKLRTTRNSVVMMSLAL